MYKHIFLSFTSIFTLFTSAITAEQQRVAVVGAGGAGLTTSWLLEKNYDVTLYEKEDVLGGHCHTLEIQHEGYTSHIDTGAEFFSNKLFPHFMKLLKVLNVPVHEFAMTNAFFNTDGSETIFLPPISENKVSWESLLPSNLFELVQFKHVLSEGQFFLDIKDTGITVKKFVNNLTLTQNFKNEFLFPFMAAAWGVTSEDIQSFCAYNVLKYFISNQPTGLDPIYWVEIEGGTINYINTIAKDFTNVSVNLSANITNITYNDNLYTITLADGTQAQYDILVMATNAADAAALLKNIPEKQDICTVLKQIKYYNTTIAVHGDKRFMPANESDWAVANIGFDGTHSALTTFKPWLDGPSPLFRSWLTYSVLPPNNNTPAMPSPLYALIHWQHPFIDLDYYHVQRAVEMVNGNQNLWFAGMYTVDNDSHESAILSAMNVAQGLAPNSDRLMLLSETN